jgi:hypothetical protein
MTSTTVAGTALVAVALAMYIPGIIRQHRTRQQLRATLLDHLRADLQREAGERMRFEGLYREKAHQYAILSGAADAASLRAELEDEIAVARWLGES